MSRTRFLTQASIVCLGVALMLANGVSAFAQTPTAKPDTQKAAVSSDPSVTTATFGAWVLRCVQLSAQAATDGKPVRPTSQTCEVAQTVQIQGQPQPIAQMALGRLPGEKDLTLTALLPVNISLPGLVRLSGNGKTGADEKGAFALNWQRCVAGVCVATAKPDAATLTVIRAETGGQIRFADASGNILSIPLSWAGLDQALIALDKVKP